MVVLDLSNIVRALLCDGVFMLFYVSRFVDQLSRSLYVEYKHSGIDVQCQVLFSLLLFFCSFVEPHAFFSSVSGS